MSESRISKTRRQAKRRSIQYVPPLGWCETHQKHGFNKKGAQKVARGMREPGIRKYPCDAQPAGQWWHVGHLPWSVRRGEKTAVEIYGDTHDHQNSQT